MPEHSPLPWKHDGRIYDAEGEPVIDQCWYGKRGVVEREDFALIVRCVNLHDELVKAVEEMIEYVRDDGDGVGARHFGALLAKAKGET